MRRSSFVEMVSAARRLQLFAAEDTGYARVQLKALFMAPLQEKAPIKKTELAGEAHLMRGLDESNADILKKIILAFGQDRITDHQGSQILAIQFCFMALKFLRQKQLNPWQTGSLRITNASSVVELEIGTPIFERRARGVRLTAAGEMGPLCT